MQLPKKCVSKISFCQPYMKFKQHMSLRVYFLGTNNPYPTFFENFL